MSRPNRTDADSPTFLGRWARRKAEARRADTSPAEPVPSKAAPAAAQPDQAPASDSPAPAPEPAPIPPLESLDENADYTRFMADDIGPELRRLALRKLFKAPAFNIRDGLDDYDEDFTTFTKLGSTLTADMKYHHDRLEQAAAQARSDAASAPLPGPLATPTTPSGTAPVNADNTDDSAEPQTRPEPAPGQQAGEAAQGTTPATAVRPPLAAAPSRPDEGLPPIMASRPRHAPAAAARISTADTSEPTQAPQGNVPESKRKS